MCFKNHLNQHFEINVIARHYLILAKDMVHQKPFRKMKSLLRQLPMDNRSCRNHFQEHKLEPVRFKGKKIRKKDNVYT